MLVQNFSYRKIRGERSWALDPGATPSPECSGKCSALVSASDSRQSPAAFFIRQQRTLQTQVSRVGLFRENGLDITTSISKEHTYISLPLYVLTVHACSMHSLPSVTLKMQVQCTDFFLPEQNVINPLLTFRSLKKRSALIILCVNLTCLCKLQQFQLTFIWLGIKFGSKFIVDVVSGKSPFTVYL